MKAPRRIDHMRRQRYGEHLAMVTQHEFENTYTRPY